MMKWLSNFFKNRESFPVENGISFIHHMPERGNIGDYLCSPRHYFNFTANQDIYILGGGVYKNMGINKANKEGIPPRKIIVWGVGQSVERTTPENIVQKLPFALWSTRDKNLTIGGEGFVPCCSCLHGMLDLKAKGNQTLMFLNADEKISNPEVLEACESHAHNQSWEILYNNCSEEELIAAFSRATRIVTNSYHGTYWGLLSGKSVRVIGYSSKFRSLLDILGVSDTANYYAAIEKGSAEGLLDAIYDTRDEHFIHIPHHTEMLYQFRSINLDFAQQAIEQHLIEEFTTKKNRTSTKLRPA